MARAPSYSETQLATAVQHSASWREVLRQLGLRGHSAAVIASVRRQATRTGCDIAHLDPSQERGNQKRFTRVIAREDTGLAPSTDRLRKAGNLLAAAWYTLSGAEVAWPLEPARYDLVVTFLGQSRRVQVKTTTVPVGDSWKVYLSTSGRGRRTYTADEVDDFFIIDGNLKYYVIPICVVEGVQAIHLSRYEDYAVARI